ncbi:MAG: sulfate ABC transporter permease [Cyclobacteriaceae bacterium]
MNWFINFRERFLQDWYGINGIVFFILLCLLYFATFMVKKLFILEGIAAFEILEERGEMWVMNLFFGLQNLGVPFFLAWKFTLTSFILWVGCFLFGYRVTYAQLWKMVMIMELIFIIPELLKVVWFTIGQSDPNYHDYIAFYPLSLINLFDYESISTAWHYPLKSINLFEITYWGLLILGVFSLSNKKVKYSALIVTTSYVLTFILWLIYYLIVYK